MLLIPIYYRSICHAHWYKNLLCISPNVSDTFKDCSETEDGTKLIYFQAPHEDCNVERMLFIHKSDGSVVHKCTGIKVCKHTSNHLLLSKQCEDDDNKYERTEVRKLLNSFSYLLS